MDLRVSDKDPDVPEEACASAAEASELRSDFAAAACSLYRCFDAEGDLIYVGITTSGHSRMVKHSHHARWWTDTVRIDLEHYATADEARAAELAAIRREQPLRNRTHADYAHCSECGYTLDWRWFGRTEEGRYGDWYCDRCIDYDPYTPAPASISPVAAPHDEERAAEAREMIRQAFREKGAW